MLIVGVLSLVVLFLLLVIPLYLLRKYSKSFVVSTIDNQLGEEQHPPSQLQHIHQPPQIAQPLAFSSASIGKKKIKRLEQKQRRREYNQWLQQQIQQQRQLQQQEQQKLEHEKTLKLQYEPSTKPAVAEATKKLHKISLTRFISVITSSNYITIESLSDMFNYQPTQIISLIQHLTASRQLDGFVTEDEKIFVNITEESLDKLREISLERGIISKEEFYLVCNQIYLDNN